jgi:hypothetical protein
MARVIYQAVAKTNDAYVEINSSSLTDANAGTGSTSIVDPGTGDLPLGLFAAGGSGADQILLEFDTSGFPVGVAAELKCAYTTFAMRTVYWLSYAWTGAASDFRTSAQLQSLPIAATHTFSVIGPVSSSLSSFSSSSSYKLIGVTQNNYDGVATSDNLSVTSAESSTVANRPTILATITTNAAELVITATGAGSITVGGGGSNPPSGISSLMVECWGAGGSGTAATNQEAGGGGGGYARDHIAVTNGDVMYYNNPAGQAAGAGNPSDTWVRKNTNSIPTADGQNGVLADSAAASSGGASANCFTHDATNGIKNTGGQGANAQSGGGSRGGSGGGGAAGPDGVGFGGTSSGGANSAGKVGGTGNNGLGGAAGAAGSGAGGDHVDGGGGGGGGNSGASGGAGGAPGGGSGGGGSSGGNSGGGARGQIRFSWIIPSAPPTSAPWGYAYILGV